MKRANAKRRVQDRKDYMARLREAGVSAPVLLYPANKTRRNGIERLQKSVPSWARESVDYARYANEAMRAEKAEAQSEPIRDIRRSLLV